MARPQKHFTLDEKKAASRIKSKRHYDNISMSISIINALQPQDRGDTCRVSRCVHAAECLHAEFTKFTHPGRLEYIDRVCTAYMKTQDQDIIQNDAKYLGDVLIAMRRHEGDILEVAGLGSEWKAVQDKVTCICTVLSWLEDLLCYAMDGHNVLCDAHNNRGLQYQLYTA
ncbi:hypothetical protein BD779DRAFT_1474465 [Infundibulicybe gibba]|nr:hypothetical protein BD779DRAFT_1474465 [Infundibulicybe gibba]